MQKIQILFPEPIMRRLRQRAEREDRPISEVIRRATEHWLDCLPQHPEQRPALPVFEGGRVLIAAAGMRDAAHGDRMTGQVFRQ